MLMIISLVSLIAAGYFLCRIAMARSRDAYGHGRMAFLAFIPYANFWLLLTPSKKAISANRAPTIPLLSGGLGVLTGFVLLAAGIGVGVYIDWLRRLHRCAKSHDGKADSDRASVRARVGRLHDPLERP